ncbi:MAG TPA: DNA/RNA non-specific endonuclease [Polyangiaceae bacterium]|nr:DNA/RNA non-specific endonuclease [Polyangiaceae bacterium]
MSEHTYLPYVIPYDPGFLGDGFEAPMPRLGPKAEAAAFRGGEPLDYIHFSVVMNKERRLAFFAANNLDGERRVRGIKGRFSWVEDPRAGPAQTSNRAGYSDSAFDHGHLARRLDVVWGRKREAEDANRATFFLTNSAPQHKNFNQDEWAALEDWVLGRATDISYRLCVFTGPVFRDDDPAYDDLEPSVIERSLRIAGDYKIPQVFWKVIVLRDARGGGNALATACFAMSQVDKWDDRGGAALMKLRTYQVSLNRIEKWTDLKFDRAIREADALSSSDLQRGIGDSVVPIVGPEQIHFRDDVLRTPRRVSSAWPFAPAALAGPAELVARVPEDPTERAGCGCAGVSESEELRALAQQVSVLQQAVAGLLRERSAMREAGEPDRTRGLSTSNDRARDATASAEASPLWREVAALLPDSKAKEQLIEVGRAAASARSGDPASPESALASMEKIIGGFEIGADEFPSCCCLDLEGYGWGCSGVLIAPQVIISAAHCEAAGRIRRALVAGASVPQEPGAPGEELTVRAVIVHPGYQSGRAPHDDLVVAILHRPSSTKPVRVATRAEVAEASSIIAAGFGNTDSRGKLGFGRKRQAKLPLAPVPAIEQLDDYKRLARVLGYSPRYEFVAGRKGLGVDTCKGDSGGPVYVRVGDTFKLAGVTSRGTQEAQNVCGDGGIYTLVAEYQSWIAEIANLYGVEL